MSLTFPPGPLSGKAPETVNYRIDGPAHQLLMQEFPRRVRATFGGQAVFDTTRAVLLHETGYLPQVYVPQADIRADLLQPDRPPHLLPVQGHRVLLVRGRRATSSGERGLGVPGAEPEAHWLQGYAGFYWGAMDEWYDEDERVEGHLRDPYHRVDVRRSSRPVRVRLAKAARCWPRPAGRCCCPRPACRTASTCPRPRTSARTCSSPATRTPCAPTRARPRTGRSTRATASSPTPVWSYPQAEGDSAAVSGYLAFRHDDLVTVEVGQPGA
jgi:uncharacterized protein (DUF427 family)